MKLVIDTLDAVAEPLRTEYEARDGKFYLKMEGDNPLVIEANKKIADAAAKIATADAKVTEFRDNNIKLLKEVEDLRLLKDKYKDLDPDAARSALVQVAELGKKGVTKPEDLDIKLKTALEDALKPYNTTITQLKDQVTATIAAAETERKRADDYLLQSQISDKFIKVGGKAKATDFVLNLAKDVFEVKDRVIVPKTGKFNPNKPGEPLTPEDWIASVVKEHDYIIEPSKGGGAPTVKGAGGVATGLKPGQTVLKNPTPQELGKYAAEIMAGKIVVENEVGTAT
jgi:hypothetical protein